MKIEIDGEGLEDTTMQICTKGHTPSKVNVVKEEDGTVQGGTRWPANRIRIHGRRGATIRGPRRLDM